MTHLTMEQLVACRVPLAAEPGTAAARQHLAGCAHCQEELRRLEQRVARLRALPTLAPARGQWAAVQARRAADRRQRLVRWSLATVSAAAAAVLIVLWAPGPRAEAPDELEVRIVAAKQRSQALEEALAAYRPEARVLDGATAGMALQLEDRIARVDDELAQVAALSRAEREARLAQLWNERVGLMDALVDVHVTRASHVGL